MTHIAHILIMILLLMGPIWLPIVVADAPPPPPPPPIVITCDVPEPYVPNGEVPLMQIDATGVKFCATRPSSGTGGIVWRQRDNEPPEIVLALGPSRAFAVGTFTMVEGYLYYTTVERHNGVVQRQLVSHRVPQWIPAP